MSDWIEAVDGGVRIRVYAQPRASRTEAAGEHGGALRVRVAAPPVDGAANDALIRFLADTLGVARSRVRLVAGCTARRKTFEVDGIDAAAAAAAFTVV